jgi:hypothetical protein
MTGILEKKNVRMVELQQFESLGGQMSRFKHWKSKYKLVDS